MKKANEGSSGVRTCCACGLAGCVRGAGRVRTRRSPPVFRFQISKLDEDVVVGRLRQDPSEVLRGLYIVGVAAGLEIVHKSHSLDAAGW